MTRKQSYQTTEVAIGWDGTTSQYTLKAAEQHQFAFNLFRSPSENE